MHETFRILVALSAAATLSLSSLTGALPAAAATPSPAPLSADAATPTPTPTSTPVPAPRGSAPTTETGGTVSADPPLATMNTARNHSMGSTIAANEPAAKSSQSQARTFSATGFPPGVPGLDVSGWQVLNASDWARIAANGARFAYVKATESTDYTSSQFAEQYTDSFNAGLLHGAYHFATPNTSSGAAQANWFLDHGGQGTADGRTMPPLLDIEYNPYGATCYGLSPAAMVSWIYDFSQTVQARTGRQPAIYSTTSWWKLCTGNSAAFAANPLFIARYPNALSDGAGALPAGWSSYTLWQFASSGVFPGDQDVFNGSERDLQSFGLISSLVRTANNASVYLVSGANKYPVTNTSTLSAFSALGHVGYVPQSYLDQFATQHAAVPIIRGQDGSVYFADSGIRLPFASCGLVSDYGGSCDASGYVQLTATQTAAFALGPAATPLMTSAGGPLFYVTGGKKHEVLDKVSLAQAGLNGSANSLSATALSFLAFGTPIVRNNVYAMTAGSGTGVLLVGGSASPIDQSAASLIGLPQLAAGTLQPASVAQLPAGARFTGAFRSSADSSVTVISSNGLRPWAAGVGGASFTAVTAPTAAMSAYSVTQPIQAGNAIMSPAGGTVYLVMPNDIRPVGSWDSLVALAGGGTPNIAVVPQSIIASLPSGPVALDPATLVRSPGNATVYLVNGVTNKIPFSTFDQAIEAGFTKFSFTSDARLNAYPTSPDLLSFGLQCGSQRYVSAGGSIHALSSMTSSLYPLAFTPLDTFTCAIAPKGIDATAFIRTPDGSIYFLSEGKKRPITSLQRFVQLSQGQPYLNVVSAFAAAIPTGAPA